MCVWRAACSSPLVYLACESYVQGPWSDLGVERGPGSVPKSLCVRQGAPLTLLVSELTAPSVRPAPPGPARPRAISSRRAAGPQHRAGGPRPSVLSRRAVSADLAMAEGECLRRTEVGSGPDWAGSKSAERGTTGGPVGGNLAGVKLWAQLPQPQGTVLSTTPE